MKRLLLILAVASGTLAASAAKEPDSSGKTGKPAKSSGTAKAADPAAPPADAEKQADGAWISQDGSGKRWIHKRTPFGWARYPEKEAEAAPAAQASPDPTRAVADLGEKVRFEKPGPFGMFRWERKKSEFNDAEKAAWERMQAAKQK
jgi:hypothetical protein